MQQHLGQLHAHLRAGVSGPRPLPSPAQGILGRPAPLPRCPRPLTSRAAAGFLTTRPSRARRAASQRSQSSDEVRAAQNRRARADPAQGRASSQALGTGQRRPRPGTHRVPPAQPPQGRRSEGLPPGKRPTFQAVPHVGGRLAPLQLLVPRHVVGDKLIVTGEAAETHGAAHHPGADDRQAGRAPEPQEVPESQEEQTFVGEDTRGEGTARPTRRLQAVWPCTPTLPAALRPAQACSPRPVLSTRGPPTCPSQSLSPRVGPAGRHRPRSLRRESLQALERQQGCGGQRRNLRGGTGFWPRNPPSPGSAPPPPLRFSWLHSQQRVQGDKVRKQQEPGLPSLGWGPGHDTLTLPPKRCRPQAGGPPGPAFHGSARRPHTAVHMGWSQSWGAPTPRPCPTCQVSPWKRAALGSRAGEPTLLGGLDSPSPREDILGAQQTEGRGRQRSLPSTSGNPPRGERSGTAEGSTLRRFVALDLER